MTNDPDSDPFADALADVEQAQRAYGEQLGLLPDRTPFAAESLPDPRVAVRVNQSLLREVASHIINRAGHVSIIDERGAGKTHFRELVYRSLRESRPDQFAVARIREVESITTRRLYVRLLDELQDDPVAGPITPDSYPQPTDEVRGIVEDVAAALDDADRTCIVQVDQLEDAARSARTFRQLLAGLQSIGDLGDEGPVFLLFLFGTPEAGNRLDDLRETLASRLVAKDRSLARFGAPETQELIGRWLAWARDEDYRDDYPIDPFTASAVERVVDRSDGTPRSVRQQAYHAYRAGAEQYQREGTVEIDAATIDEYA